MLNRKRSFNYFEKFIEVAGIAKESANFLSELVGDYDSTKLKEDIETFHIQEHKADDYKYSVINQLIIEFIPPIDREDIILLIRSLDRVVDDIEDVALGLYMLRIKDLTPEVLEFVRLIEAGTSIIEELVIELENFKRSKSIKEKVRDINVIEDKADDLYVNAMRNLYDYSRPFDPRVVISFTRLYDLLESTVNSIEQVANNIESIVLKNK